MLFNSKNYRKTKLFLLTSGIEDPLINDFHCEESIPLRSRGESNTKIPNKFSFL